MIHKTAILNSNAQIDKTASIGPNTLVGEHVVIGANTRIGANCVVDSYTKIGTDCEIFTGAIIGSVTQDKKYKGGKTYLEIGDRNQIREYTTINSSTDDSDKTVIGSDNMFMAYSHVAHNCKIGNKVTFANNATLAGHVIVEDLVVIGGLTAIHQFTRIGRLAIIGGCSKVVQDILPYSMADGHPAKIYSTNSIGLDRAGFNRETKMKIKRAIKILCHMKLNLQSAVKRIEEEVGVSGPVKEMVDFAFSSERGFAK